MFQNDLAKRHIVLSFFAIKQNGLDAKRMTVNRKSPTLGKRQI